MLTVPGLSAAIKSVFISVKGAPQDATELQEFCDIMATGIVTYLVANTAVNPGIPVTVSTGTGVGATTAPGTIS